nr:MAG TPA: hypothetical protein [Caudoviricetes sp.]
MRVVPRVLPAFYSNTNRNFVLGNQINYAMKP